MEWKHTMEERRTLLRHKINILRQHLREGVDIGLAATYLREIAEAEWELRNLGEPPGFEQC